MGIGTENAAQVATAGVPNIALLAAISQGLSWQTLPQPSHLAGHQPLTICAIVGLGSTDTIMLPSQTRLAHPLPKMAPTIASGMSSHSA